MNWSATGVTLGQAAGGSWVGAIWAFVIFFAIFAVLAFVYFLVRNLLRSREVPTVAARKELDGLKHLLQTGTITPEEYHVMRKRITSRFAGLGVPLPSDWDEPAVPDKPETPPPGSDQPDDDRPDDPQAKD